jgi:hypothetical protein
MDALASIIWPALPTTVAPQSASTESSIYEFDICEATTHDSSANTAHREFTTHDRNEEFAIFPTSAQQETFTTTY